MEALNAYKFGSWGFNEWFNHSEQSVLTYEFLHLFQRIIAWLQLLLFSRHAGTVIRPRRCFYDCWIIEWHLHYTVINTVAYNKSVGYMLMLLDLLAAFDSINAVGLAVQDSATFTMRRACPATRLGGKQSSHAPSRTVNRKWCASVWPAWCQYTFSITAGPPPNCLRTQAIWWFMIHGSWFFLSAARSRSQSNAPAKSYGICHMTVAVLVAYDSYCQPCFKLHIQLLKTPTTRKYTLSSWTELSLCH